MKNLAAKKQSAKKSSNRKQSTVRRKAAQPAAPQKQRNSRVEAIIYALLAAVSLVIIFVKGGPVWMAIRGFFYGLFGMCIVLIPVLLVYLAVITTLEKKIAHFGAKIAMCVAIFILTETLVFLFSPNHYEAKNFFQALGSLFYDGFSATSYFASAGGLISGILGFPLYVGFGGVPSILVSILLLAALLLIICRVSLNDIGRAAQRVGRQAKRVYEHGEERRRERRRREVESYDNTYDDGDDIFIDIPIEGTSKRKPKKQRTSSIDISLGDDRKDINQENIIPSENNTDETVDTDEAFDNLIEVVKRANQDYSSNVEDRGNGSKKSDSDEFVPEFIETPEQEYTFPPVGLLSPPREDRGDGEEEMRSNAKKLIETLESFGVKANITHISRGPSVTRYELRPAPGVKITKITNLSDDIALALAANGVRIEAPIPGKAAVGIEVPNKVVSVVSIRELIDSDEFESSDSKLTCVLGRDIAGQIVTTDISKMPHLLIAGTTGSGKSVCVNSLLISILFKASPDEVKLVLIDPKMVEFSKYKGIPHLLIPVVSDAKKAAGALAWAVNEMTNRYKIFADYNCKDINSYNKLIDSNIEYMQNNPPEPPEDDPEGEPVQPVLEVNGLPVAKEKLPRIVIAIDELADLMMTAPGEVEDSIVRLAQLARAAGMHLVIATQRPTANVITGLIKANVPSRIALKVGSNMDSRIILDTGGAEKLIGRGDMLYLPMGAPNPIRVQGCFATDDEIDSVTAYIKKSYSAQYNEEIEERIRAIAAEELSPDADDSENTMGGIEVDAKMEEAIKFVIESGQASTSMIQRRLHVGYARAGRMIDDMEQLGIIGPHQGSKPREVIMSYSEWLERSNNLGNGE